MIMDYIIHFEDGPDGYLTHSTLTQEELDERKYALPEQRKFPLPDRAHVLSAIRFFNYVEPKDEKKLAAAILKRMRELGMSDVNVGDGNRFIKYYGNGGEMQHAEAGYLLSFEDGTYGYLAHHGIKGMKWGVWNDETRSRYTAGPGHRSITKANKKVDKKSAVYQEAVKTHGQDSYQARAAAKQLGDAVEKREFRVEKNRPGEGNIDPDRYNELRSNQRVKRSALMGAAIAGPWGAVLGAVVSTTAATAGKRAVADVFKKKETYRVNKKTGQYEGTEPWNTESNRVRNNTPVYVTNSTRR